MITPSTSERNFVPTSTALVSPVSASRCGRALAAQMLHGQPDWVGARVVNVQLSSLDITLPAKSLIPAGPPLTSAVYVVVAASDWFGSSVAVRLAAS